MKLEEARDHIGDGVVYSPSHGKGEDGVITSVNTQWVFVRYIGDMHSKATAPDQLTLLMTRGAA